MPERRNEFARPQSDRSGTATERFRATTVLFAVGLTVVAANSALYFFGVESLSHPVVSVLALALLVPQFYRTR